MEYKRELHPLFETLGLIFLMKNWENVRSELMQSLEEMEIDGEGFYSKNLIYLERYVREFEKKYVPDPGEDFFFGNNEKFFMIFTALVMEYPELEADMEAVLKVVVLGRACRNAANMKNRQPIGTMYVKAPFVLSAFYTEIIAEELNVKRVEFSDDVSAYTSYSFKPQLRTVGPKYGKYLGQIKAALSELDGNAAMNELKSSGMLKLDSIGENIVLLEEDLLITMTQAEGYVTDQDHDVTVVLDTNLTAELIEEGFVRELISKIQTMRKEAGFEVTDKITVSYRAEEKADGIFSRNKEQIAAETLAEDIMTDKLGGYEKEWNINGERVSLEVKKLDKEEI